VGLRTPITMSFCAAGAAGAGAGAGAAGAGVAGAGAAGAGAGVAGVGAGAAGAGVEAPEPPLDDTPPQLASVATSNSVITQNDTRLINLRMWITPFIK